MRRAVVLAFALSALGACQGDRTKCEKACRNYATLVYWKKADAEIAALPKDQQETARKRKLSEFSNLLENGVDTCVNQCASANNDDQIACMTNAKTADEAQTCIEE